MTDRTELYTVGQMSRRTGLPVTTIRFWADSGLVPPTRRSAGRYRLFDADAVARLDLVRTLRDLGLDLDTVQQIIAGQTDLIDVARAHLSAIDAEIRTLRLRRTVLRSVADRRYTTERLGIVRDLARLSIEQRQRIIDDFVARTFAGVEGDDSVAAAMWQLPTDLPDDPTPEQVDAWVELAELVADDDFQSRVRQMAVAGASASTQPSVDPELVSRHVGQAMAAGVAPYSQEGRAVLDRLVEPDLPAADRNRLADETALFTDRRVERYWHLMGVLRGWPPAPSAVPAFEWFVAALRASAASSASA